MTGASTPWIPASDATAFAAWALSPLIITVLTPWSWSPAVASVASGRMVSRRAITPARSPSLAASTTVLPSLPKRSSIARAADVSVPPSARNSRLPSSQVAPSKHAEAPAPGNARYPETSLLDPGLADAIPLAIGCSLRRSIALAASSNSSEVIVPNAFTSVTENCPSVSVPVLSNTTVSTFRATSSAPPSRIKMPFSAARPIPTASAAGVASPSAHGQAMISTLTALFHAMRRRSSGGPAIIHAANVAAATPRMIGTNTAAIRSASRAAGALEPCARRTNSMIWERAVSAPTLSARKTRNPSLLSEPLTTRDPGPLSAGTLSPVIGDSSTAPVPSRTVPSTGILSPGCTRTSSPAATSSSATSISTPFRRMRTAFACSAMSFRIELEVRLRARVSITRPSRTSVRIAAAVSK